MSSFSQEVCLHTPQSPSRRDGSTPWISSPPLPSTPCATCVALFGVENSKLHFFLQEKTTMFIELRNEANQIRTYLLSLTLLCIYCVYIKTRFTNAIRIWSNLKWNEASCVSNCQNSTILKISVYEKFVNEIHMFQCNKTINTRTVISWKTIFQLHCLKVQIL